MGGVVVDNWRELNRLFAGADKQTQTEWRDMRRQVAEPTRRAAEGLAVARIRNMARSPAWAGMRTGVTRREVYVAPRKRSRARGTRRGRPRFAPLLQLRAMNPALRLNTGQIRRDFERMLDQVAVKFNGASPHA